VLAALGEVPSPGDSVKVPGYTIMVTEMDGRRIARLRVTPAPRSAPAPGTPAPGTPAPGTPAAGASAEAAPPGQASATPPG
jgi:putative hemolysin